MTRDQSKRERMHARLAEMFRAKFEEMDLAIIDTGESAEFADAVLEVVWPEIDEVQAAIERVRDLHWRSPDRRCAECGCGWPCPTRFALDNRPAKKRKGLSSPGGAS